MTPWTDSLPLVPAAAGKAVATEMTSAIPAATSVLSSAISWLLSSSCRAIDGHRSIVRNLRLHGNELGSGISRSVHSRFHCCFATGGRTQIAADQRPSKSASIKASSISASRV